MSTVSSLGQSDLAQILQRSQGRTGRAQGGRPPEPPAEVRQQLEAQFQSKFQSAAKELGIDTTQFAKVGGQIKDAVQSAVQNNQGASPEDLQKTISSTIDSVLEENGIDAKEFKAQFEKIADKAGLPKPGQGFPGGGSLKFPGNVSVSGNYSANSADQQQRLVQQLLGSLSQNDSQVSGFFSNAEPGSFLDAAA